tara:strand:- start:1986 stop:3398 length:1413 start_codon:yes stop_codon:yes gene_type:complete
VNVSNEVTTRRENLDGVEHYIVPVIAAKETVMNGSLYLSSEFERCLSVFEGVPIPVSHPKVEGLWVSARTLVIHEANNIGTFQNVKFEDKKLKGELWINIAKAEKLNHSYIIDNFEKGMQMEVSIGVLAETELTSGTHDGVPYTGIIRNMLPDHLAVLVNELGACSIEKGCGAMRVNKEECSGDKKSCGCGCTEPKNEKVITVNLLDKIKSVLGLGKGLTVNTDDSTQDEKYTDLEKLLSTEDNAGWSYIVDIFDTYFVYADFSGESHRLLKRSYTHTESGATLGDDTQEVVRRTSYLESNDGVISNKEKEVNDIMDKKVMVQSIISNCANTFAESDNEVLEALSEDVLSKMVANEEPKAEEPKVEEPEAEEPKVEEPKAEEAPEIEANAEFEEFRRDKAAKLEALKSDVIANSAFDAGSVEGLSADQLSKIIASSQKPSYLARGAGFNTNAESKSRKSPLSVLANKGAK